MDQTAGHPGAKHRTRLGDHRNVVLRGAPRDGWRDAYHLMLTMPLGAFLGVMATGYLLINLLFAWLYFIDPAGVAQARPGHFIDYFFFSVQTLGTLGYGVMSPRSLYTNIVVTCEVFTGLFNLAIATGVLFARVSRPTARIMFSNLAVVTAMNGEPTLMMRAANRRRNLVLEAEVSLTLVEDVTTTEGDVLRRFQALTPVRRQTPLFFLTWQIMHVITPESPLYGQTAESLAQRKAEILVIIRGLDETYVADIHARASYLPHEIIWDRRFADILALQSDGTRVVDLGRFDDLDDRPAPCTPIPPLS
ncbi:MAG TPA: ion channel [Caulobacteraceae bacterium]|jgi:inward rectifier potassium channel|nr:ion channel [Caulobacteraceae bacterium]